MYPLPPELSAKIFKALGNVGIAQGERIALHDNIAALLVRENRRLRQKIAVLQRDFAKVADRDDREYGEVMAAACGEYTCEHISNTVVKPNVYFNRQEDQERKRAVEDCIQDFYDEDPPIFD